MARVADRGAQKKLTDAARHWARGGPPKGPTAVDDAAVLGLPAEDVQRVAERVERDEEFEVWPENWPVLLLFLGVQSQWHIVSTGMGRPMVSGLRYEGVAAYVRMAGIPRAKLRRWLPHLQAMERAAVEVMNEARQ